MPLYTNKQSVAANATVTNVLAGSQYEFLPFAALVEIGLAADASGVLTTVSSGSDILQEEGPVPVLAAGVFPKYPDEFHLSDEAAPGDRLKVAIRNTTGGAVNVITVIKLTPMA